MPIPKKIYDVESFIDDLDAFLKAKVNPKIAEVNADFDELIEDPDDPPNMITVHQGPTLLPIPDNAYVFQSLDDRVANYNPFVFYEIATPNVNDPQVGGLQETYMIMIIIAFASDGADIETGKKLARYNRVLKELFVNGIKIGRKKIKIVGLQPAGFANVNDTIWLRATGLNIEVTFG